MHDDKEPESLLESLPSIETDEGVREIMDRAGEGDEAMLPLVRKVFDLDRKKSGILLDAYGNVFARAREAMTKHGSGKNLAVKEALKRKINKLRDELAGLNPTPLERILCERIALCWYDANEMDRRFVDQSEITFKNAEYRESRRDRAHKRFLAACKTLATVRKLGVPAIQVNLAHQQVNVAGSSGLRNACILVLSSDSPGSKPACPSGPAAGRSLTRRAVGSARRTVRVHHVQ